MNLMNNNLGASSLNKSLKRMTVVDKSVLVQPRSHNSRKFIISPINLLISPKKILTLDDKSKKQLQFGFYFLIKRILCNKFLSPSEIEKVKLYDFSKKYIMERFDVIYYLKTLEKVDRIKILLFNTCQNLTFDFIKKPNLHDKEELESLDMDLNPNKNENAYKIIDYYTDKVKSSTLDDYDRQLYYMLDSNIKRHIKI